MRQTFARIIFWFVSLAILNTSVDVADDVAFDANPGISSVEEYNEIESLAELLMEEVTDQSLPDNKGNDSQGMLKKSVSFNFSVEGKRPPIIAEMAFSDGAGYNGDCYTFHLSPGFRTIFSPPPNIAA